MQWVGIDKVKKADGTTLEMGDALVSLSTGTILDGAVTAAKLAANAITEAHTAAGTFTTASISNSAGITGTQLASTTVTGANIANTTITNGKLAANAVTESKTLAGTFTTASLSATAAIAGSQLAAAAAIAGTQLAANAAIAGTQLAANAAIAGSQLSATAGITGGQLATGVKGNIIGPFQINYSGLTANKDVITGIPLGFIGSIVKVYGIVVTAGGGADSGTGTLTFTLSASGILQSAGPATVTLPIAKGDTLYQVTASSAAPTLQNTFVAADTLKISYVNGTTFGSTDTGVIWVYFVTN